MDKALFWYNLLSLLILGTLHLFFSVRFTGKQFRAGYLALYLALLYAVSLASGVYGSDASAALGMLFLLCTVSHFVLENDWLTSGITSVLAVYVTQLCNGMAGSAENLIFPHVLSGDWLRYCLPYVFLLLSAGFCICCFRLIFKCFSLRDSARKPYLLMLFPACSFFYAAEFYIYYSAYGSTVTLPHPPETGKELMLLLLQAAGLAALLITLYACRCASQGVAAQQLADALKRENHVQETYVEEAKLRYMKTKRLRHDMKNHLSVLAGLLKSGKTGQAEAYLGKLDAAAGELSFPCLTGNTAVDILLGNKLELADMWGIDTEISVVLPEKCGVDDMDLCVIFANAADNALHACMEAEKPGYFRITGERQGDFYILEFENSCLPGPPPKPGIGLMNIKAAAEKYKGAMGIEKTKESFRLHVLLDISNVN